MPPTRAPRCTAHPPMRGAHDEPPGPTGPINPRVAEAAVTCR